ncbi:SPE_1075/MLC_0560 family membrane protein [Spiroplasma endosymbiont of Amphibalanus improvisus]|uniref:SPE_1075/MLC_0560 family membrane protein n=1 Tax=Spiroplasma endosymbiont of Amphibalanus improvisus TaxID=3066327 RepID=UPI00313EFC4A
MKKYLNEIKLVWKNDWKTILFRFGVYIFGVYIFGLGIALYLNTQVGLSQIDITVYAYIVISHNITTGVVTPEQITDYYSLYLIVLYVGLFIVGSIMKIYTTIRNYLKFKDTQIIYKNVTMILLDIIPIFLWPLFVSLSSMYVPIDAIGQMSAFARTWIFMGAFLLYCLGIALVVYSNLLLGPYNSLSANFCEITKINYKVSRVLFDCLIASVGIISLLINNPPGLNIFWDNYFVFGTIFMMFISGPIIGLMLKYLNQAEKIFKNKNIKHYKTQLKINN